MDSQVTDSAPIEDDRAVAPVIAVVILFGFLVLSLSLYQAQLVPQQNAGVEFEHFEGTSNDLVELRASILQAGSIDRLQYQTVRLGATYPTRVFAINPSPPVGTIRTTDSYPITIAYASNGTVIETIPTRFIQYRPGYNELDQSPIWYDASVLYVDGRGDGGGIAVIEDQALVDEGEVRITALQNEFRRSGTDRVTLEFRPAESVTSEIPEANLTVTIPTRLSGDEYWDEADVPTEYDVTSDTNGDGVHNLTVNTTGNNLTVDTVGVQQAPEEPTQNDDASIGDATGGDGDGNSNQSIFRGTAVDTSNNDLIFSMENTGSESVTVEEIGVNTTRITPDNSVDDEITITGETTNGQLRTKDGKVLQADGTTYDFKTASEVDTPSGEYADVPGGAEVEVDIREFAERLDNGGSNPLQFTTSAAEADVVVTFVLRDGTEVPLYLEQS